MPEINKPSRKTYYLFLEGDIVRTGATDPGLVTTSGMPTLIQNTDEVQFLKDITIHASKLPTRPVNDRDSVEDVAYDDGGVPKIIRRKR